MNKFFGILPALAGIAILSCGDNTTTEELLSSSSKSSSSQTAYSSGVGDKSSSSGSNEDGSSNSGDTSSSSFGSYSNSSSSSISSSGTLSSSSSDYVPLPPPTAGNYPKLNESQAGVQKGWASRYWDGCKPSCSWPEKNQSLEPWAICRNCDIDDKEIKAFDVSPNANEHWSADEGTKSSCDGGVAFTCFDMAPIAINDTLAYAFAATPGSGDQCGKCFQIQFDGDWKDAEARPTHKAIKGKTLIVMSSNIGHDVGSGQFDILVPGGGVGAFDSFSKQLGVNVDVLGAQMGGLLTSCEQKELNGGWNATLEEWQTCLRKRCNDTFGTKSKLLLDGCLWFADWYMAANNPTLLYKETECPQYLLDKYKSTLNTSKPKLN